MAPSYTNSSPPVPRSGAPPLSISTSSPRHQLSASASYTYSSISSKSAYTPTSSTSTSTSTTTPSSSSTAPFPPHRTVSEPFNTPHSHPPLPTQATQRRFTEPGSLNDGTGTGSASASRMEAKRRLSNEGKTNVHTECGRHSDEWLFGGFSVAGVVRKMLNGGNAKE